MIIFILIIALFLRLVNLNQSLWLDEAVQAITAQKSLSFIAEEIKGDFHPPLYHILMHFWVRIFGSSEIALRLPSVLFGVGTVLIVYLIAREIGDKGSVIRDQLSVIRDQGSGVGRNEKGIHRSLVTGRRSPVVSHQSLITCHRSLFPIAAALLMATAPFHIYYSQEGRMYSLVTFFSSLSVLFFIKLIKKGQSRSEVFLYLFLTTVALYSDYFALLVLLAQLIVLFTLEKKRHLLIYPFFVLLAFIPGLLILKSQLSTGVLATASLPGWGKVVSLSFFKAPVLLIVKFIIGRITIFDKKIYGLVSLGLILGYGGLIFNGFRTKGKESEKIPKRALFFWFLTPFLVSWLLSPVIPNFQPFRLLLVLPAFYLILNYGIFGLSPRIRQFAYLFIILVNFGSFFVYYKNPYFHREDWRGLAGYLKEYRFPLIISAKAFDWPLVYYQTENRVISVVEDLRPVGPDDQLGFTKKITGKTLLSYTPYLADIYDPSSLVPTWIEKAGFVKMKEVSFNQIPLWIYERSD